MGAERISSKQVNILLIFTVFGTVFITLPRNLSQVAGHSGWIAILLAAVLFMPLLFLILKLCQAQGRQDLIPFCLQLMGPVAGRLFSLLFILFPLILYSAATVRMLTELFVTMVLPEAPLELLVAMVLLLRVYLVSGGLSSISRWAEVVMPIIIFFAVLLFLLSFNKVEMQHIEPFWNKSVWETLKGSCFVLSAFSEMTLLLFLWPYLRQQTGLGKPLLISTAVLTFFFLVTYFFTMGTYGATYTSRMTFPVMEVIQDIELFNFIEHMEGVFLGIWVLMNLTKGAFTLYAISRGFQHWFGASDFRRLAVPLSVIIYFVAITPPNLVVAIIEFEKFKSYVFPVYCYVTIGILLLLAKLKARSHSHG